MSETIELKNVGPINHLSIPVPEDGGVVVLKGMNGSGKSHAIAGVQSLHDKEMRKGLPKRDGAIEGTVEGVGVKVRLGRVNTAKGELSVTALDSVLDPSLLVDPGIKDPSAADAKRLQVVARLAGIKVDRDDWIEVLGQFELEAIGLTSDDLAGDDPVAVADSIRRKLHAAALKIEKEIEGLAARADVAGSDLPEDLPESIDLAAYHSSVARAEAKRNAVRDKVERVRKDRERRELLASQIEQIGEVESIEQLQSNVEAIERQIHDTARLISELELQLANHKAAITEKHQALRSAKSIVEGAKERAARLASLQSALDETAESAPLPSELVDADQEVIESQMRLENAMKTQEAIERYRKWQQLVEELGGRREIANRLREAARSTDTAIEKAFSRVGLEGLCIESGRLCVKSDRGLGGVEPFSDLSHGERWRNALDIASRGLGKGALLAVSQEAWESLDPANRRNVASMASDRGIVIVTAECSDGDLRAEVFDK